jgi:hypothetical protein
LSNRNYAATTITALGGSECIIQCYSQAPLDPSATGGTAGDDFAVRATSFAAAVNGYPFVANDTTVGQGVAAAYNWAAGNDSLSHPSNILTAIVFDPQTYPRMSFSPGQPVEYQARTVAWGIRISFVNELSDTKGWVEFIEPYEAGYSTTTSDSFNAQRRTRSYRRRFFSDHRTHEFIWTPNCEAIKFAKIDSEAAAIRTVPARSFVRLGGLANNDEIMVEIMSTQEIVSRQFAAQSQVTHVTPDSIHVQNALASYPGANPDVTGNGKLTKTTTIAHEVTAHKIMSHPILHKLAAAAGSAFAGKGAIDTARSFAIRQFPKLLATARRAGLVAEEALPLLALAA